MGVSGRAFAGLLATLAVGIGGFQWLIGQGVLPEKYEMVYVTVVVLGAGFFWKGFDLWRFRRVVHSLGYTWEGWETPEEPPHVELAESYRNEVGGRTVTVACSERGKHDTSTFVVTPTDDVESPLYVRRSGLGGKPESSLPPRVSLSSPALSEYDVYCSDTGVARTALTGDVQRTIADLPQLDVLRVEDRAVKSMVDRRVLDADLVDQHVDLVCEVADAVESSPGEKLETGTAGQQ